MIEVVTFQPKHTLLFKASAIFDHDDREHFMNYPTPGAYGHTLIKRTSKGTRVVGCMGGYELWKGVAAVWCLLSDEFKQSPIAMTKYAREFMSAYENALDIHRLQAYVRADSIGAIKWAESCGFIREGLLRKYSKDKSDVYIMGRVR